MWARWDRVRRVLVRPPGASRGDPLNLAFAKVAWDGHVLLHLYEPIAERQIPRSRASLLEGAVVTINAGVCPLGSPAEVREASACERHSPGLEQPRLRREQETDGQESGESAPPHPPAAPRQRSQSSRARRRSAKRAVPALGPPPRSRCRLRRGSLQPERGRSGGPSWRLRPQRRVARLPPDPITVWVRVG